MPALRKQLLKIQRRLYLRNLRRIEETLAPDPALERYAREYHTYLKQYQSISSTSELIRHVMSSDVVYHGDYHPLKQSQRSVLRILREIVEKRKIILCLEMFYANDQRWIDQFLQRKITQKEFLEKIDYKKKWGFKWEHWKPVIDLCKKNKIPIAGINSDQSDKKNSLLERDIFSAIIIGKLLIRNPDTLIYVVDGDYHISPNHLPLQVEERLQVFDIAVKRIIIYQNSADLYWQLAHEHKEESDVVEISDDSFCIFNTTPANKLQSYLNWLEFSAEAYHPVQAGWEDLSEEAGNTTIPGIVNTICKILALPYPDDEMERLEVYYGKHLDFMSMISKSPKLSHLLPSVRHKIRRNEGFLLEYERNGDDSYLIYLPISSLNMAAEEATHLLNSIMRGRLTRRLKPFDYFYYMAMTEAIGYFGSKLINEKRKVQTRNAIRRYLGSFKHRDRAPNREEKRKITMCHLILKHRYYENLSYQAHEFREKLKDVYQARTRTQRVLATQLGYMLGEKIFLAVRKRKFPLKGIIKLFSEPFTEPYKAFLTYINISQRVNRRKIKKDKKE
jgi:uncharacterized iron-regulated protein